MLQTLLFAETLLEFWRDFAVILNSDPKLESKLKWNTDLFSFKEWNFLYDYTPPGEKITNLLLYLLKMKTKYFTLSRNDFGFFLENSSTSLNVLSKQWKKLSKSFNMLWN